MNTLERLKAVTEGSSADRPPCICPGGMMNMIFEELMESSGFFWPEAHSDSRAMAGLAMQLRRCGGFENYGVPFCMTVEAEAMGASVEIGDRMTEPHIVEPMLESASDYQKLPHYDYSKGRIRTVLDTISIIKANDQECPVIGNLTGPFSLAGSLVDMSVILKELRRAPESVHALMNRIAAEQIGFGRQMIDAGADFICISEPSGTGEIMGRKRFLEFSVKYINDILHGLGKTGTIVHICGDLSGVYDLLGNIKCDVFSFDAVVPVKNIRPYLGDKAVMGNVSTFAIGSGNAETVRKMSLHALEQGADILAPACGLSTGTPLENVRAMVETAETFIPQTLIL